MEDYKTIIIVKFLSEFGGEIGSLKIVDRL